MTKLLHFFIRPFTQKGIFWGVVDLIVKILAVAVWGYLVCILASLVWQSIRLDYNPLTQLWWCSYAFLIFFGSSLLAYIACFVRDYNEYEETDEAE